MTIASALAERIVAMRYEDLPTDAIEWAKISIVDLIGCAFAGVGEEAPRIAGHVLLEEAGAGPSLIWGTTRRVPVLEAAEINGVAGHALDYDDINNSTTGHPSVALMPGIFALAERLGASGCDVLLAFIAGWETQAHVAHVVNMHHYEKGWHPTSTICIFGAAAACSRLLRLNAEQTATALNIAVSMACGVKANFGSMTKPLHAGQCSRHGAYAALLAKQGFTANPEAFEHKQGYFEVYNGAGNYNADNIVIHWAAPLDILNPGAGLKQYPCCAGTHSAIDAMIALREKHGLRQENVVRIASRTHARVLMHTNRPDPQSTLDAKFSVQYCMARALMHGDVGFAHFEGGAIHEPEVRSLLARTTSTPHDHQPKNMDEQFECHLEVETTDGKTYTMRVDQPLRGPTNLTPPDRLESKFADCASRALVASKIPGVYKALRQLETFDDVRKLTNMMADAVQDTAAKLKASG